MQAKYLLAIVLVAAIAVTIVAFSPFQKGLVIEGVSIDSGSKDPYSIFADFSKKSTFIVSPQMNESTEAVDHLMFNGMALFLQVTEGNNKEAVQLIRVYKDGSELSHCLTNYGDVNISERLENKQCLEYLSKENAGIVLIEFPDQKLSKPVLEINKSKLIVRPKSNGDIGETCFLSLRIMFKNSEEIVGKANSFLSRLNS